MNLQIKNFKNDKTQLNQKCFCLKNGGENILPIIIWKKISNAKTYSLIMEDPYSIHGNTIHLFIPIISKLKIMYGLNSYDSFGWYGPCPPPYTGKHKYIFTLYSLDKFFDYNIYKKIKSSKYFEKLLKKNNIIILNKEIKIFEYDT